MLRLIGQEFCPIPEFAKVARTDAAFSAEILRFANSPIIAMRFEVVSILHAISVLGLDRLRSLVLTLILRNLVVSARANEMLRASWRHNFACALACEWMAAPCDVDAATAYTAGLLHEVGRMALTAMFGQRHLDLIRRAAENK